MIDAQIIDLPETESEVIEEVALEVSALEITIGIAQTTGDISDMLDEGQLTALGAQVIDDYDADKKERDDWERVAKKALERAAQEKARDEKTYPWAKASNFEFPLLTTAAFQFNARAYAAIVKGDEAVSVKVVGSDKGMPIIGPDGQPMMQFQGMPVLMTPQGPAMMTQQGPVPLPEGAKPEPAWQRPPGTKTARARRVADYLNTTIFYRMEGWEADTDLLLIQLPIIGCAFRKVYYDPREQKNCANLVSAMNLIVPCETKDIKTATRISECLPRLAPYEILENIKSKYFRPVVFIEGEEFDAKPRELIEQHMRYDLDGDGYPEPYVVTVDVESREVCRIVANFSVDDIKSDGDSITSIASRSYYVKYEFFPHPEGKFYGIGLGHLLDPITNVLDTVVNQIIDANTAAVAGGGFIGSGVRLQGTNRSSTIRLNPGEYKTVNVPGDALRNAIVERHMPQVSQITFQVLELMLGAAQDISSTKDVLTGDASNNGQVGTTLALIEQGLQVFTSIYKRVYRSLKDEFQLLFENTGRYATEETQADYVNILDDPTANIQADFNALDMDIRPVSDPTNATKMQEMSRANFLMSTAPMAVEATNNPVLREILRRVYETANIENIEDILIEAPPAQPDPKVIASAEKDMASAGKDQAQTAQIMQDIQIKQVQAATDAFMAGMSLA